MVLLRVAAAVYFLTHLLVAAAPVVVLASFVAISHMAPYASRRGVGQWGGAGGAICEDHFGLARGGMRVARRRAVELACSLVSYMPLANRGPGVNLRPRRELKPAHNCVQTCA